MDKEKIREIWLRRKDNWKASKNKKSVIILKKIDWLETSEKLLSEGNLSSSIPNENNKKWLILNLMMKDQLISNQDKKILIMVYFFWIFFFENNFFIIIFIQIIQCLIFLENNNNSSNNRCLMKTWMMLMNLKIIKLICY